MLGDGDHRHRDWAALPGELLACIRGCLRFADFVRFAAVCRAWRRFAPSTPVPQLPWLMLPPSPSWSPADVATCRFFSPSEGKTYLVPVPELRGTLCVGSCEGWVASFDEVTADLVLVNPLTRARIPLPSPLTAMPLVTATRDAVGRIVQNAIPFHCHCRYLGDNVYRPVKTVVMSSKPTDPACKIAASFDCLRAPAFVAVGGEKWKVLEGANKKLHVVCPGGDGGFYGVDCDYTVFRWDVDAAGAIEYCPAPSDFLRQFEGTWRNLVVHRPSGDLFLVFIDIQGIPRLRSVIAWRGYRTEAVKAFRYRGDDGSPGAWQRVESLGGYSLFLGTNAGQSICLSAQDVPELKADCVFFIAPEWDGRGRCCTYPIWVYNLKEGTLERYCYCSDWKDNYQAPLWFTPHLS